MRGRLIKIFNVYVIYVNHTCSVGHWHDKVPSFREPLHHNSHFNFNSLNIKYILIFSLFNQWDFKEIRKTRNTF